MADDTADVSGLSGPVDPGIGGSMDAPKQLQEDKPKGKITIENGQLVVTVDLNQKHAKILAKGLLMDAINTVDEFFFIMKQKQFHDQRAVAESQKRVIDRIIKPGIIPNGRGNGI